MSVIVFPPQGRSIPTFDTTFALKADNWSDHGFRTLYQLYRRDSNPGQPPTLIGSVKILRQGQTGADALQISKPFERLDENFCSVGTSLDYYQRLNEIPTEERDAILEILRDVVRSSTMQDEFKKEEGWQFSLFRDNPNPDEFLADALAVLTGNFSALPDLSVTLSFLPDGWHTPLALDFSLTEPWASSIPQSARTSKQRKAPPPHRVIAIIGRNGAGKSTLLSRIARVAFAAPSDRTRPEIKAIGTIDPPSVGFTRIIAVSYSAFDNFSVPGLFESEMKQIAADIEFGRGRYIYCGLRDIAREVQDDLNQSSFDQADAPPLGDRRSTTNLKSLTKLAEEFERLVEHISRKKDAGLFEAALKPLLTDLSFSESSTGAELIGSDPKQSFLGWSTGHKIALHIVASMVAHAAPKSLVLIDEPEMHLHPPLTAALMHSVRVVLEAKDAFAVVATHSPVVLQETLARHVRIVRRIGDTFDITTPKMETFGENVGALTYDVFGLTASATDFHETLDLLTTRCNSLAEIHTHFTPRLAGQALAYVMAELAKKGKR